MTLKMFMEKMEDVDACRKVIEMSKYECRGGQMVLPRFRLLLAHAIRLALHFQLVLISPK